MYFGSGLPSIGFLWAPMHTAGLYRFSASGLSPVLWMRTKL
jgi:hypothetical protein